MKRFKKAVSIALTLMMLTAVIAGGLSALAVTGTADITIHPPTTNNLYIGGQTFDIYQIFSVDVTLGSSGEIIYYAYTLNPDFDQFCFEYDPTYGTDLAEYMLGGSVNWRSLGEDLLQFADDFGKAPLATETAGASDTTVTFSGVPYGYYMVVGNGKTEDGAEVTSYYTFVTVPSEDSNGEPDDVDVYLKADAPEIDKQVWNHNLNGGAGGWDDWTDVNIGDIVDFKHTSAVPVMTGYEIYRFIVHDSMSKGLTLDMESFEIILGGDTLNPLVRGTHDDVGDFISEDCDYIVVNPSAYGAGTPYASYGADATDFAIVFNPARFVKYTPGKSIEIYYSAMLNEDAVIADVGNPNKVYLEYSNNPYDNDDTGETPEDEVWVYTFELDVYKFTGGASGTPDDPLNYPVADAVFELYRGGTYLPGTTGNPSTLSGGTKVEFVQVNAGNGTDPAIYRVATEDDAPGDITTEMITPESGLISILGLDADQYYLHEVSVPLPYNADKNYHPVLIVNEEVDLGKAVKYSINAEDPAGQGNVPADMNIYNGIGDNGIFPGTGGIGRTIFILAGIALMVGATVTLTVRKKMRKMVI